MTHAIIHAAGEELHLLPERAVWWPSRKAIVLADLHLGKAEGFRSVGIPVPDGSSDRDLQCLGELATRLDATELYIAGDMLHAKAGMTAALVQRFADWRGQHRHLKIVLVRGNHDARSGPVPPSWSIHECGPAVHVGALCIRHDAVPDEAAFQICGHVHPVVILRDASGGRLRGPCFLLGPHRLLLPAFGMFTGGQQVWPDAEETLFLCGPNKVARI